MLPVTKPCSGCYMRTLNQIRLALVLALSGGCGETSTHFGPTHTSRPDEGGVGGKVDGGSKSEGGGGGDGTGTVDGGEAMSTSVSSSSGSGGGTGCAHSPCVAGAPLNANCEPLVHTMCTETGAANAQCCSVHWTELCASQWYHLHGAGVGCGITDNTFAHSPCVVGDPLDGSFFSACSQLVADLCHDPNFMYCCSAVWDTDCVNQVQATCTWSDTACTCL